MRRDDRMFATIAPAEEADLSARFRRFAERECRGVSPLYQTLARAVAKDREILVLAARASPGPPRPNMLFAAVRLVLLSAARDEALARFYPDLTDQPASARRAAPVFRDFCRRHHAALAEILRTRVVSTNEPARSACLLPAFALAARRHPEAPLHLIEIGVSAGLNLVWDRYAFDYGPSGRVGDAAAGLHLRCAPHGRRGPPVPAALPAVASRLGIDKHPLRADDAADALWLRALIWPEQAGRAERLSRALAIVRADPPPIVADDAMALLPRVMPGIARNGTVCLYHSFTLNQFSAAARQAFEAMLVRLADRLPFVRIGLEWGDGPAPELRLHRYCGGAVETQLLAYCDPHGAWIEWLAP